MGVQVWQCKANHSLLSLYFPKVLTTCITMYYSLGTGRCVMLLINKKVNSSVAFTSSETNLFHAPSHVFTSPSGLLKHYFLAPLTFRTACGGKGA